MSLMLIQNLSHGQETELYDSKHIFNKKFLVGVPGCSVG